MNIKRYLLLIIITILTFSIVGCDVIDNNGNNGQLSDEEKDTVYEPSYGGNLTVPLYNVKTLNPLISGDKSLYFFNKLIFEGLFDFDKNLDLKNVLAESYNITNDGKLINIKLREDVFWHSDNKDKIKFTADDVKFTIDVLKYGAGNSTYKDLFNEVFNNNKLSSILKVKVTDDYNITIEFDKVYSNALESLTFPIIAKHQFTSSESVNKSVYNKALNPKYEITPKGTGPYKIVEFRKSKSVKLEANNDWWNGKPYIKNITGLNLSRSDLFITAFESGSTDLAIVSGIDWGKYYESKNISIYEFPTQNYEFLAFNFNNEFFKGETGKYVRKAIAYAIDTNTIIQKEYLEHATKTNTPFLPSSWLNNIKSKYKYDTEKAKEMLKEAGFEDRNDDGVVEDINGKELRFRFLTNSDNEQRLQAANTIVDNLRTIGIDITPQYEMSYDEESNSWDDTFNKVLSNNYDIALLGWRMSYIPDLSFAFHSRNIKGGYNFINYNNPKMDELLEKASGTVERETKENVYEDIQEHIDEELPYLSLYYINRSLIMNNRIKGEIEPLSFNIYNNIHKWFIPEKLRK